MLVLARKEGESILIGQDVLITVTEICGDKVRLGIEAPRTVPVHRLEVAERMRAEGQPIRPGNPKSREA